MSVDLDESFIGLHYLEIDQVEANKTNPRLDFPTDELERLSESIDHEGVLVPIVVFRKDAKFVLVDGERRFRCARDLGHLKIPAVVVAERSDREVLQQMFNIHQIREPWRDIPTAQALVRLADATKKETGKEVTDAHLRDLTGLSIDRVRQLRYVMTLPEEWQGYIRRGEIPLNYFWELKKNVLDQLRSHRPALLEELGEANVSMAFVQKRLDKVVTDTVSLRKMSPIIKFAEQEAETTGEENSAIDDSIRELVTSPTATIEDAYEETVQMMVEVDRLGRRTQTMAAVFVRLLSQTEGTDDNARVREIGADLLTRLAAVLSKDA